MADCLDIALAKGCKLPDDKLERFRQLCLAAIEQEIALEPRQALGLALGRVGDPRIIDPRDPAGYVRIPSGRYPFQDGWIEIEEGFALSRYPVTNSQFDRFIQDGGYQSRAHWSPKGWKWLQKAQVSEPFFYHDRLYDAPNQPVVGVSWWEAAARGSKAREYPWDGPWEDGICNTWESRLGTTSPVGLFPRSRQADFGLEDLAGNVWEWVSGERLLRGGSWGDGARIARAAFRYDRHPDFRSDLIGFRVLLSLRQH